MDQKWTDLLVLRAAADEWYQKCLKDVKAREPDFLAIRGKLPLSQQQALDGYIAACEELEHALALLSYRLGQEK